MTLGNFHVLIALGGNLPWQGKLTVNTFNSALEALAARGLPCVALSRFFRTPCFPAGAGPDYVNACAQLKVESHPSEILAQLHAVEAEFGRERISRWAGRTLDLDLLAVGDEVLPNVATWRHWHDLPPETQARAAPDQLILPHPRLQDRAFVLVPLADIAPDWVHPVLGRSVRDLMTALPPEEIDAVVPLQT